MATLPREHNTQGFKNREIAACIVRQRDIVRQLGSSMPFISWRRVWRAVSCQRSPCDRADGMAYGGAGPPGEGVRVDVGARMRGMWR